MKDGTETTSKKRAFLRDGIARLTSPRTKLTLLAKHGFAEEAAALVLDLVERVSVSFMVVRGSYTQELALLAPPNLPFNGVRREKGPARYWLELNTDPDPEMRTPLRLDMDGMALACGWEQATVTEIVRKALGRILEEPPKTEKKWYGGDPSDLEHVIVRYLKDDERMRQNMENWFAWKDLRSPDAMHRAIHEAKRPDTPAEGIAFLNGLTAKLMAGGWTEERVQEELVQLLCRAAATGEPPGYLLAIARCAVMEKGDGRQQEIREILSRNYLPMVWESHLASSVALSHEVVDCFVQLGRMGLWEDREAVEGKKPSFIRTGLVRLISDGRPVRVRQLLTAFRKEWLGHLPLVGGDEEARILRILLPEAFAQSFQRGDYGTAAALLQQFGRSDCAQGRAHSWMRREDEEQPPTAEQLEAARARQTEALDGVTELAIALEQPIRLELPLSS